MWWLAACGSPPPDAWEGVEQAVVWDTTHVVVDRASVRRRPDGTELRTVDRCRWVLGGDGVLRDEGCVVGPAGRSTLSKRGGLLLDERVDDDHRRTLVPLDPATLAAGPAIQLGLEPEGRVPGGSLFVDGSGVITFVNHGLSGVDVADGDGRATYTVERWDGPDGPTWRRALTRYPREAHAADRALAVLDEGAWRLFDLADGTTREAPAAPRPGACLGAGRLWYLSADEPPARVEVPLDGGAPTLTAAGPLPGWVGGCVLRDGRAWFHGGTAEGDGWVLDPDGRVDRVPRVDLELGAHVDADGRWWFVELGRGYVVWDPVARAVTDGPRELHDVIRAGDDLVAYGVGVDLTLWARTRSGDARRPHRTSPRPWHVADGQLWTFAHRVEPGVPAVEVLALPDLRVAASWPALP